MDFISDQLFIKGSVLFFKIKKFLKKISWETHQFFLTHFFGKHTNFSYLIFLENPPIFLPHFLGKPTNFSYLIFFWETH